MKCNLYKYLIGISNSLLTLAIIALSSTGYCARNLESSAKNVFHALRILDFGIQIKNHKKITNFSSANDKHREIYSRKNFDPYDYYNIFLELSEEIKK